MNWLRVRRENQLARMLVERRPQLVVGEERDGHRWKVN